MEKITVGLDIGTTKIVAVIGRENEHGKVEVLGIGKANSTGVNRGVVNNIVLTIDSISEAVEIAEKATGLKIRDVVVGIAGQHIRSTQHSDYIVREDAEKYIEDTDIDRIIGNVHNLVMMPGEEILHVLPQEFKVDNQSDIKNPRGMYGSRLEANFHIVVGQIASIRNVGRCVKQSGLNVKSITLEPIASSEAVLSPEEKEAGVVLVDIGGGTTDVAIFKDGIIRHTAVIPIGGKVITEDIKEGCEIIEKQAETLKVRFGSCWPGENSEKEIVSIPGLRGRDPKEISLRTLSQIIHARMKEIIESVFQEMRNYGYTETRKKPIAGIVLTGGGAQLKHIAQLFEFVTGLSTRIGYPSEHLASGSNTELSSPQYATSIGLVMRGLHDKDVDRNMAATEEEIALEENPPSMEEALPEVVEDIQTEAELEAEREAAEEAAGKLKKKDKKGSWWDRWSKTFLTFLENDVE
jgi:cell division protein FtsA